MQISRVQVSGIRKLECGMRNAENKKRRRVSGIRKLECGLRPIGAYAYAPAGRRKIGKGARLQPSSHYGVTMVRQAVLKAQGIKIRHLTLFNSTFRIPNSEFKYL